MGSSRLRWIMIVALICLTIGSYMVYVNIIPHRKSYRSNAEPKYVPLDLINPQTDEEFFANFEAFSDAICTEIQAVKSMPNQIKNRTLRSEKGKDRIAVLKYENWLQMRMGDLK